MIYYKVACLLHWSHLISSVLSLLEATDAEPVPMMRELLQLVRWSAAMGTPGTRSIAEVKAESMLQLANSQKIYSISMQNGSTNN